jgi:3',5'-cyclic AMP phosphodiesterase CpdA
MMLLAHISDPHFGTEDLPVCSALRADLVQEAPDLVVLTGDITQRARSAQFVKARVFLDSLSPLPVLALPGNHDLPLFDLFTRFTAPYGRFRRHICGTLAPLWQGPQVAVIAVNSTRVMRHKHGELPAEIVGQVARQLAQLRQRFRVVALHHPLAVIEHTDVHNRARNADEALAQWIGAGADLFLGGHIHLPYCISAGGGSRHAVVLQAGTSVSTRRRGGRPNSYNLVRFESNTPARMNIEQRDHDPATGRFVTSQARHAVRGAEGWTLQPWTREE